MVPWVISGGQTGADRGGLDAAIRVGVPHAGWCPAGRKAEDGVIPQHYRLTECRSADYLVRTELNIRDSDLTIVFTDGPLTPGSRKTLDIAKRLGQPALHFDISRLELSRVISSFVITNRGHVINVAGSRESKSPGMRAFVESMMSLALRTVLAHCDR